MGKRYTHLSLDERRMIYYWRHYDGLSIREMARRLRRCHSTICREIRRNSGCWCDQYYHNPAHHMVKISLARRARRPRLKAEKVRCYVRDRLSIGWSPELIAGRIKHVGNIPYVCHESIYQYIYKDAPELIQFLPRKHKKRRFKRPSRRLRPPIADRRSILDRPAYVLERTTFGHWESDSLEASGRQ